MALSFLFEIKSGWCWARIGEQGIRDFRLPLRRREDALREARRACDARPDRCDALDPPHFGQRIEPGRIARKLASDTAGELVRQVRGYFAGRRAHFDLALDWAGATDFRKAVWSQTARIPFGGTMTYGDVARAIGNPNASRAVGQALGANPIPLIVPCHRVLAAGGGLGGFSAEGGAKSKRRLIEFESSVVADS